MKATTSATGYTDTTFSNYVFSKRVSASGTFSIAGNKLITEQVQLSANTTYYIWAFGLGDDGVDAYDQGFITVQGLNT